MAHPPLNFVLAGVTPSWRALIKDGAGAAFPGRKIRWLEVADLLEAVRLPLDQAATVVVLDRPVDEEVERALAAEDERGRARWAVVACGTTTDRPGAESVAEDEQEVRLVARALRSALAAWQLRQQLARERGDLWTVGRRLTHDLRNPLGCIVTTGEMLKEILAGEAPEHVPFLESILESSAEILEMINRVNFMAKASAQPAAPEWLEMDGVRQAAIDRVQREITQRRAQVTGPEDWPQVKGVRPWLEVVWMNLLTNALRHGGEPPVVETGWRHDADGVTFWVSDQGPGVQAERVGSLFTPFDQLHRRHGGGLGLSIVHRLVELHGGRCAYESRRGGGATFQFTLPVERAPNEERREPEREPARRRRDTDLSADGGLAAWASPAG